MYECIVNYKYMHLQMHGIIIQVCISTMHRHMRVVHIGGANIFCMYVAVLQIYLRYTYSDYKVQLFLLVEQIRITTTLQHQ